MPFNTANGARLPRPAPTDDELDAELAKLNPPRKYYQNHQRTPGANDDMLHAPQGLHAFFRAYYHYKSADWKGNNPHPLKARTAEEMAQMPDLLRDGEGQEHGGDGGAVHAVAGRDRGVQMADRGRSRRVRERNTRARNSPARCRATACGAARTRRAWPRCARSRAARIDVPLDVHRRQERLGHLSDAGRASSACEHRACTRMVGFHLLDGAGHWVQQEQPEQVSRLLLAFLKEHAPQTGRT